MARDTCESLTYGVPFAHGLRLPSSCGLVSRRYLWTDMGLTCLVEALVNIVVPLLFKLEQDLHLPTCVPVVTKADAIRVKYR